MPAWLAQQEDENLRRGSPPSIRRGRLGSHMRTKTGGGSMLARAGGHTTPPYGHPSSSEEGSLKGATQQRFSREPHMPARLAQQDDEDRL